MHVQTLKYLLLCSSDMSVVLKHRTKHRGLRSTLASAAFVYHLGIACDAVAGVLCDSPKHLKERQTVARSRFWSVRADSSLCVSG